MDGLGSGFGCSAVAVFGGAGVVGCVIGRDLRRCGGLGLCMNLIERQHFQFPDRRLRFRPNRDFAFDRQNRASSLESSRLRPSDPEKNTRPADR
jgi:hypothetical protein